MTNRAENAGAFPADVDLYVPLRDMKGYYFLITLVTLSPATRM